MRRVFIAFSLLVISVVAGVITNKDLNTRCSKHIDYILEVKNLVEKNNYFKAEKICKKAADEYNFTDSGIMYNYYTHNDLSEIGEILNTMRIYIKEKDKTEFYHYSDSAQIKLNSIINKKKVSLENIL